MRRHWFRPGVLFAVALMVVATLTLGTRSISAQEATPPTAADTAAEAHPAHIHSGTCDDLGGVVYPLNDVIVVGEPIMDDTGMAAPQVEATPPIDDFDGTPDPTDPVAIGTPDPDATPDLDMLGTPPAAWDATPPADEEMTPDAAEGAAPDAGFFTNLEVTLDELLAAEHAINIHESAENIQNYIACGNITGEPVEGELEVQLEELNDSGYSGVATLRDNLDGTTTVIIALHHNGDGVGDA
jgi:hypothetical protein